jgi:hypothetical protein
MGVYGGTDEAGLSVDRTAGTDFGQSSHTSLAREKREVCNKR